MLQWQLLITALRSGRALPHRRLSALPLLALAAGLALGSERPMRTFWTGLSETWRERGGKQARLERVYAALGLRREPVEVER